MNIYEDIMKRLDNPDELKKVLEANPAAAPLEEYKALPQAPTSTVSASADPCLRSWFFIGQPPGHADYYIFSARSQGKCAQPIVLHRSNFDKISEYPIPLPCLLLKTVLPIWEIRLRNVNCDDITSYPRE